MTDRARGILALVGANLVWGFAPLLYKALAHLSSFEVLAHRTIWTFVLFGAVILVQGRLAELSTALRSPDERRRLFLAAILISINWGLFIYGIAIGRALEAGLAYYIFPVLAVLLGVVVLGERLLPMQWVAVGFMSLAIVVLGLATGAVPILSLILACSFAAYGLVKRRVAAGPTLSVTAETTLILPVALVWVVGVAAGLGPTPGFLASWTDSLLLLLCGPVTGAPLILFTYAARRLSYATLGLIQYLNPTLQAGLAVMVFGEAFSGTHGVALGLIWTALAIYSVVAFRHERAARRAATVRATSV